MRCPTWCPGGRQSPYTIGSPASSRSAPVNATSTAALAAVYEPSTIGVKVSKHQ